MFFEDEKENTENNNSETHDDLISWDDSEDDLISIKDSLSDKEGKNGYDDEDEISGLSSIELDDELKLIEDDDAVNADEVDDVDDEELARILNENDSPSKQKAFDAFGTGSSEVNDDIIEEDFDIDDELEDIKSETSNAAAQYHQNPDEDIQDDETPGEEDDDDITYQPKTSQKQKQQTSPLLLAVLFAVLVAAGVYFILGYTKDKGVNQNELPVSSNFQEEYTENIANQNTQENIPVVNEEEVDTIKPDVPEKKEVINIQSAGKINPFMPIQKYVAFHAPEAYYNYDASGIPKPPAEYGEKDEVATKLMTISVSGIMYDDNKPGAIITLDNNDYFVQKGDKLDEYKVVDITRTNVKISLGKNIYKANLGEEFKLDSFYGNIEYIPGGRQYHAVSQEEISTGTSRRSSSSSRRYTSENEVQVNPYK